MQKKLILKLFLLVTLVVLAVIALVNAFYLGKRSSHEAPPKNELESGVDASTNIKELIAMVNTGKLSSIYNYGSFSRDNCNLFIKNKDYTLQLTFPEANSKSCFRRKTLLAQAVLSVNYPSQTACEQQLEDSITYLHTYLKAASPSQLKASHNSQSPFLQRDEFNQVFYWDKGHYNLKLAEQINQDGHCKVIYNLTKQKVR